MDLDKLNLNKKIYFLPDATRGAVRSLTTSQLKATGTEGIVVNTLHLLLTPGPDLIQSVGGIHKFMNWDGLALSDSGGFQVFSLLHSKKWKGKITKDGAIFKSPRDGSEHILTPERSIDIQMKLDSNILVVLDDCRKADITREEAEISVQRTIEWARRAKNHFEQEYGGSTKTQKMISAVVQGGGFIDLRTKCAERLSEMGFDGYNFGGYVINDQGNLVVDEMKCVLQSTPDTKFKYAMGVGKPIDIFEAAKIGYTLFDTVLPTRNARHGTLYIASADGAHELRIKNSQYSNDLKPIDSSCNCEACKSYSRSYIHNLLKIGETTAMTLATIHNIRFYQRLVSVLNENQHDLSDMQFADVLAVMRRGSIS